MSSDLISQANGALAEAPSHAVAAAPSNLAGDMQGGGYPRLKFKGNRFRVDIGGEERVLETMALNVVILEANAHVSRLYYGASYNAETSTRPDCASADGVAPLAGVPEPQSSACNTCPMNEKGSAIMDNGGKARACSFYKRLVVMLVDNPELGPLVTDAKAMSLFGTSYPDRDRYCLRDYAKRLDTHKVAPFAVVTTLRFDDNESVPKLLFQATAYTSPEFHAQHVAPLLEGTELGEMVSTEHVQFEGDDDNAPKESGGFRDTLMGDATPEHAAADETPPAKEEAPEELTPAQKAAITRAKNKAIKEKEEREKEEEAKANAAAAAEDIPDEPSAKVEFNDELDAALDEFGF